MRVILRDGRVAELRAPDPAGPDREMVKALFLRASPDSRYFRFFHVVSDIRDEDLDRMLAVVPGVSYALVADVENAIIAIGNYARIDDATAEVAFFVEDQAQGRGLGTLLLEHLAEHAWRSGFREFVAYVLQDNLAMLRVFYSSGFTVYQERAQDVLELRLPLTQTDRQKSLAALREKLAAAASLEPFFRPAVVAVVGASRDETGLGYLLLRHILDGPFQGTVYPVNRDAPSVAAIRAYARLSDIPEPVDLAIVAVPRQELLAVVNDAIYAGVRGLIIASSTLGQGDAEGRALQETLVAKLRRAGIRLIGPHSMGLVSTDPSVRLNGSLAPEMPAPGHLAVASHSGAIGVAIMEYANRRGLGISSFVSLGNKADVSVNDLLQYWEDDPATQAMMLYMESFGNPRKFSQIARRLTRHKPILAVKSARRPAVGDGVSPPFSWMWTEAPVDALFRQSGIIRADTLEELFDVALLVTSQPLVTGPRLALATNTPAGTRLARDIIGELGLHLVRTIEVGAERPKEGYRAAIRELTAHDEAFDALLLMFVPMSDAEQREVVSLIEDEMAVYFERQAHPKAAVANILLLDAEKRRYLEAGPRRIPVFSFPENAIRAVKRVWDYAQYVMEPAGQHVDLPDCRADEARGKIRAAIASQADSVLLDESVRDAVWRDLGLALTRQARRGRPSWTVGIAADPLFGPLVGVSTSRGSVDLRLIPLTDQEAQRLVPETVTGDRVRARWVDLLLRLSRLVEECPEVEVLELRQVQVSEDRVAVGRDVLRAHR
ncbi:MAG: GNAT family N-acetyltransferase [Firmicutes bacterium]|nr:GNAT family N-acetyltransferase [Bacillota bacterium]